MGRLSGPTLLTGLIRCAKCGGAMTIRTGKCGRYRYYACSMKARRGPTACEGKAVSMERLDNLVASHLADRLLQPNRLEIEPLHTETVRLIYRLALHHDGAPCIGSSPRYRNEPAVLRERSDMEPQLEMVAEEAAERLDDHHIERRGLWRDCLDHALELRAAVAGRRRTRRYIGLDEPVAA